MNLKNRIANTVLTLVLLLICSLVGESVVYSYGTSTRTDYWTRHKTKTVEATVIPAVERVALFEQPLWYGTVSIDTARMQDFLRNEGHFLYPISTGYYGPLTQAAIADFQQKNNLTQSGMVDDQTRALVNHLLQERMVANTSSDLVLPKQYSNVVGSVLFALTRAQSIQDAAAENNIAPSDAKESTQKLLDLVSGLFGLLQ